MTRVETAFQPTEMRSSRPSPRRLALLGATGSIGRQVCDLVERHPDRFTLHALVAGSDAAALEALARRHPEAHAFVACMRCGINSAAVVVAEIFRIGTRA